MHAHSLQPLWREPWLEQPAPLSRERVAAVLRQQALPLVHVQVKLVTAAQKASSVQDMHVTWAAAAASKAGNGATQPQGRQRIMNHVPSWYHHVHSMSSYHMSKCMRKLPSAACRVLLLARLPAHKRAPSQAGSLPVSSRQAIALWRRISRAATV